MPTQSSHRIRVPHGVAFPVHELVFVRAWAEGRGLAMRILLDQVLDGAEFEEMLLLHGLAPHRRGLTLWRLAGGGVVAQLEGAVPLVFGGIHSALTHMAALSSARPARVPEVWRRLLGWGRR